MSKPTYPPTYNPHVVPSLVPKPWVPPPSTRVTLINCRVVDVVKGRIIPELQTIKLEAGKITSISETSKDMEEESRNVVDVDGRYICPGLIDCHVHIIHTPGEPTIAQMRQVPRELAALRSTYVLRTMLTRGFTTVRDLGGANKLIANALEEGVISGPRLIQCGYVISQTGGHGDSLPSISGGNGEGCCGHVYSSGRTADGVPAVLKAVREEIKAGADFIKLMIGGGVASPYDSIESIQFTPDEVKAATMTAWNSGRLMCTAHAYTPDAIRHAVDNGVRGIEHGNLLDEPTAQLLKDKGIWLTPTLATYGAFTRPPFDKVLPPSGMEKNKYVMTRGLESLTLAHETGVQICFGTDLLNSMHALQTEEFTIRSIVLPSEAILRQATVNAAKMLGFEGQLGVVASEAIADLIVLARNPLQDITVLDRPEENLLAVIKEGRLVSGQLENYPA
ncbi:hypothetical protein I302_103016 [Kwoniella bestiolae CBS 10118]|uniref:Amidohydrolase-related domain-containing protein n=1 Tax=Kwoniella bestiolae CBS 10118 TaxID=1296100 RepID=A0A1B9GGL6_9TREE|nr:hypothetical protein I302_01712 [Kwoniella bestiolae CBS 10118]OCF30193.1 hypothetical protein I302_01712 [Kwoniella bestiolae CBS 10118]